jgi:hypothetical protein
VRSPERRRGVLLVASTFNLGAEQPCEHRRRRDDLLEVVEDEEHLLVAEILGQRLHDGLARLLPQAERLRDGREDQLPVADRRQ